MLGALLLPGSFPPFWLSFPPLGSEEIEHGQYQGLIDQNGPNLCCRDCIPGLIPGESKSDFGSHVSDKRCVELFRRLAVLNGGKRSLGFVSRLIEA